MPFLRGNLTPDNKVVAPYGPSTSLTAAQVLTLNTAPVTIIPAPGVGKAIALNSLVIEMNRSAVAFTGGGAVGPVLQGATGTFLTANQMAATDVTTGGAGQVTRLLDLATPAGGVGLLPNTAVQLFAGTANFAAGTGTMKVMANYSIIDL
jgi:hypothetical protein